MVGERRRQRLGIGTLEAVADQDVVDRTLEVRIGMVEVVVILVVVLRSACE